MIPFYYLANRGGIPRVESEGVTVSTSDVKFSFRSNLQFSRAFSGLVLVRLAQAIPSGTTGTLPVVFTSTGAGDQALTTLDGAAVTVDNIGGTGVYLAYYEASSRTLQLLTGFAA